MITTIKEAEHKVSELEAVFSAAITKEKEIKK